MRVTVPGGVAALTASSWRENAYRQPGIAGEKSHTPGPAERRRTGEMTARFRSQIGQATVLSFRDVEYNSIMPIV